MLCGVCETFLTDILHRDFAAWKRVNEGWCTFRHGDHATVSAAARAGCELCALFNAVRAQRMPQFESLGEKWLVQPAWIDFDIAGSTRRGSQWTFRLLTHAPATSWIAFEIFNPSPTHADTLRAGEWQLVVPVDPVSTAGIQTARGWIDRCVDGHPACRRPGLAPLPTRVIDVGPSNEPPIPRLLVTGGQLGRYVTLSHCWGTGERITLGKVTLGAFQRAIPFDELPPTFQDAITITRLLGLRYLWIDALCIIQDDQQDWLEESASMCAVFENALLSISALSAESSHAGILHHRERTQILANVSDTLFGVRTKIDSLDDALRGSKLESRAWCLQERMLSNAILHFAPDQLHWECRTCTASETAPAAVPREAPGEEIGPSWLDLVSMYSARQITKPSDRLPAIAGLAAKAKKDAGDASYLHGLWSNNLHASVLWKRPEIEHGRRIPSRDGYSVRSVQEHDEVPRTAVAPSFSWASINSTVDYSIFDSYTKRMPSRSDAIFRIPETSTSSSFPQSDGVLEVEGLVKRGYCKAFAHPSVTDIGPAVFKSSGSRLSDGGISCFVDDISAPVSRACYCLYIASWKLTSGQESGRVKGDKAKKIFYLILERAQEARPESTERFRRIGMGFDLPRKVDKIFANAERRSLELA